MALPSCVKDWTLTTLRDKLIKIGVKVVHHACYVTVQLAEVPVLGPDGVELLHGLAQAYAVGDRLGLATDTT